YHQVVGTLATVDIYSDRPSPTIKHLIERAVRSGHIGRLSVSNEGFEFHVIKETVSSCGAEQFTCKGDGRCIDPRLRCNRFKDCADGSDELEEYALCSRLTPIIHPLASHFDVHSDQTVELSVTIRQLPPDHQVIWSKNGEIIAQGGLTIKKDPRIHAYRSSERYFLKLANVTDEDAGRYKVTLEGLGLEAVVDVRVIPKQAQQHAHAHRPQQPVHHRQYKVSCPHDQKACQSGHCLPHSRFCDGRKDCPDGDDESNCNHPKCASNELQCRSDGVCLPKSMHCDGVEDCRDGSDEANCTHKKKTQLTMIFPPHQAHHSNVPCPDGSTPEYSLKLISDYYTVDIEMCKSKEDRVRDRVACFSIILQK
ncbi:unnamed protein product, partial [Anisakis simplex]|uniref:Ig-like domain-containing protein n=1 Tax=Anisakis simplex TaxID=6269 RepID=A0A0M3IYF5_ANISI